jgi:hypothetical protein
MTETENDDLLAELRSARPDPGYRPSPQSPEAAAMLSRILDDTRGPGPVRRRGTRRRLVLAGLPSLAAAITAVVIAVAVAQSGPAPGPLAPDAVRTAVLDALQQDSGDILQVSVQYQRPGAVEATSSTWVYPAFPAVGQQVRYRELDYSEGKLRQDVESVYTEDQALEHTSVSTTQGPASAKIIGVDYPSRTWATFTTSTPLVDLTVSPALIHSEIASGNFTVDGTVKLNGHDAVKLGWTHMIGPAKYSPSSVTTLWVDATTYVPLRMFTTTSITVPPPTRTIYATTLTYQMIPATTASLKALTPPIPAGFTRAGQLPGYSRTGS